MQNIASISTQCNNFRAGEVVGLNVMSFNGLKFPDSSMTIILFLIV